MASTTIAGLWRATTPVELPPAELTPIESDPFTDRHALAESQVLDVRLDAVSGRLGVLLELRVALGFTAGDTGLLVVHGIESFSWRAEAVPGRRVREVGLVAVDRSSPARLGLTLGVEPGEALACAGHGAEFSVLAVAGLPAAPPDYTGDDEAAVQAGLPQWESSCRVLQRVRS